MDPLFVPLFPDAAAALGIGRTKAYELARLGELPTVVLGGRRVVPVEKLREYAARVVDEQLGSPTAA